MAPDREVRRLELSVQFDYRRPMEVRAMVRELQDRMEPVAWAMLETLAIEVCRQASMDLATVHSVAHLAAADPE